MRLDRLMADARTRLRAAELDTPDLDARLLVEWATGKTRLDLISAPEQLVDSAVIETLSDALDRREKGEPVHRIMGVREFFGLPFRLSAATLEPRPDTEVLVELVIPALEALAVQKTRLNSSIWGRERARSSSRFCIASSAHTALVSTWRRGACNGANQCCRQWCG